MPKNKKEVEKVTQKFYQIGETVYKSRGGVTVELPSKEKPKEITESQYKKILADQVKKSDKEAGIK